MLMVLWKNLNIYKIKIVNNVKIKKLNKKCMVIIVRSVMVKVGLNNLMVW